MSNVIKILLVLGMLIVGYFFFFSDNPKWSLFYYPTGCIACEDEWVVRLDVYESKETCVAGGRKLVNIRQDGIDSFECGVSCDHDGNSYICDETVN